MRTYAFTHNNEITSIQILDEDGYLSTVKNYELGIDIDDIVPQPELGWVLSGITLVPPAEVAPDSLDKEVGRVKRAVEFGSKLKKEMAAKIGAKNKVLNKTEAEIIAIVSQLVNIGLLLEGGAIRTSRTMIQALAPSMPTYFEEIAYAINKINTFLGE